MFPQAEAVLLKFFVLKGGKTPLRRLLGDHPPIYSVLGSPVTQVPQEVEVRNEF